MSRFLQIHALTAYPPANLNRDDVGRPKTAIFGGAPRLRISSQSLKRAWRQAWRDETAFRKRLAGHLADRTQRFGREVERHLAEQGVDAAKARSTAIVVADLFGKPKTGRDNPVDIEQLAFISPAERTAALALAERLAGGEPPTDVRPASVLQRVDTAIDIAMFGRMLADDPDFNREAAVQVAHAITTHRALVEDDYYTAVDDLKSAAEDAGAGFVGEAGFGAGLFYLYLCVDRPLLTRNLAGDGKLAALAVAALIEAVATVAPRGKQASFASRARASYLMAERGETAPRTLAAAFLRPVGFSVESPDLLAESIARLRQTRDRFSEAYSEQSLYVEMDAHAGSGRLADVIAFAEAEQ